MASYLINPIIYADHVEMVVAMWSTVGVKLHVCFVNINFRSELSQCPQISKIMLSNAALWSSHLIIH